MSGTVEQQEMWERACVLTRLVAHSVKCAESAGKIMKVSEYFNQKYTIKMVYFVTSHYFLSLG